MEIFLLIFAVGLLSLQFVILKPHFYLFEMDIGLSASFLSCHQGLEILSTMKFILYIGPRAKLVKSFHAYWHKE